MRGLTAKRFQSLSGSSVMDFGLKPPKKLGLRQGTARRFWTKLDVVERSGEKTRVHQHGG
jgi:hypothetical protein